MSPTLEILILLFLAALLSGLLGRLGGAGKSGSWYDWMLDTKLRDVGCSLIITGVCAWATGWVASFWWVYVLIFALHWGAFSTYWDRLFGYDNLWFSGAMVGLACLPILWIDYGLWWAVLLRTIALAGIWGLLNACRRPVWKWRADVVEEYLRYFCSL